MTQILRMSNLYAPTLKEDPSDADIASARLLLRAGMLRKTASGVYTFLPLGWRVLHKIEDIVREEMDAAGAQEILMPALQPAKLWHESGRWNDYGPELMRLTDRHDNEFCLGPTHEELIVDLVRNELRSYKELPVNLYQIQTKYRDEIRPRFGLLRSREFIMKDAYSFNASQESVQETYDAMGEAYKKICDRCGLEWREVEADGGQIGGSVTAEFMALAESGEAELVYCSCGYAADAEAGACMARPTLHAVDAMEKIATPGVHTIAELAEFLDIPESSTVKALSGKDAEGNLICVFIPGDHELNELKIEGVVPGFELLTDEEMKDFGLCKGSMGPVGLPENARIIASLSLKGVPQWVVGANEDGYHYVGARLGEDFQVDEWADLATVKPGDCCPECGLPLDGARGIEVAQIFQLGDKYSKAMGATFMDEEGNEVPFFMGCYGVGISRTLAAIVEQHNDEHGIMWPPSVAPAQVCVVPLTVGDEEVQPMAEKIARDLSDLGFDVVVDDRDERAGVKFNDADLIGWPVQIVVGKRGLKENKVEVKLRRTGEKKEVGLDVLAELMGFARRAMRNNTHTGAGYGSFDAIFG
ncbi:proline--tRNA ligase [Adlercreutzia sp. R21]|uniref:proline--tRNA ligase n=1 Tax=Adlercreutzia wanghongyangiae TaxID=3111451 RepID=UPI002DB8E1AC|nr:proline--tRNA ligase [Adlercreutzia sp. R21]MEC4183635.1 proline--tRNA ligase [Adlercreutzia sp. R21]